MYERWSLAAAAVLPWIVLSLWCRHLLWEQGAEYRQSTGVKPTCLGLGYIDHCTLRPVRWVLLTTLLKKLTTL